MNCRFALAVSTVVLVLICHDLSALDASPEQLPHILIVLVDDMGYGDPKCYNPQSKISTPNIDALAREGMRFVDAHAPGPLCHLSRYGLLTGEYPFRANIHRWPKHAVIDTGKTTIASMLQAKGYRTAMVGKWHLGFEEQGYDLPWPGGPVDVGFNSFFGIRASTDIPPYFYIRDRRAVAAPTIPISKNNSEGWSPIQGTFWRQGLIAPDMNLIDVLPKFTDEAISIIQQHQAIQAEVDQPTPLMLYLALPAPHTPWLPTDEFVDRSQASMYGDFTSMVDAMLGRVLAALDEAKMTDETLVIFTSDNGPVWYERDVERIGHDSSGGLRGMKADAWEAGHRMPFIVRWPGKVAPGSVNKHLVCFTDLLATLANVVGYDLRDQEGPDSFDFSPELLGDRSRVTEVRTSLVMKSGAGHMTVREGDWKLIDRLGSGGFSRPTKIDPAEGEPAGQLYNLADDLAETNNLYSERADIVSRLQKILANEISK